jgi:Ser/Thr protein kinase RdoA (MazF antagonist)
MSRRSVPPATLRGAALAFGLDPTALVFVRDVANVVHRHTREAAPGAPPETCFLRLTHREDRSPEDVRAELSWVRFLSDAGLPVCRPRACVGDGGSRLTVRADPDYTAACFARVRGVPCEPEDFAAPVFERMGAFLGDLHRTTSAYRPPDGEAARLHWHELDSPERVLRSWGPEDARLRRHFEQVHERLQAQPASPGRYGLIHGDVHRGNLFVHATGIDVFDFDDCCRAFHVMDLAHAVYYALWDRRYAPEPEREDFARRFLGCLLRGYRARHALDDEDLALLPDLLEYRELAVDAFTHRRHLQPDADLRRRWSHVRDRIARGAPYVRLDPGSGAS